MNLAAPWGLAAAALTGPLIVWYVLRSRRPRVTVGSTFLWERTDRSVAAAIPWQRFRPDVTFWLVLLALLAGAIALARPFIVVTAELGDHTILIVDASASMLAVEDGPTRLELGRREARDLVGKLGPGQTISVIEAGTKARVLLSASPDPGAINDALNSVRPSHGAADLVDAFTLTAALERPGQSTVVHLLTDGIVPDVDLAAAPVGLLVDAVGTERPNLAVTRLQAVPVGAGANQVFVQVRNFATLPATARLSLAVARIDSADVSVSDRDTVVEQELRLGPRGTQDLVLSVTGGDGDVLVATIEPTGEEVTTGAPSGDALELDNRAFAVLAAPRELTILIAGPGNVFLEAALASLPGSDGLDIQTAATVPPNLIGVDLLIVDRAAAPAAPEVPTLYIAPTSLPAGITNSGTTELPAMTFQKPGDELLADVDLSDVAIAEAAIISAPALTTVAGGTAGPLIMSGRLDGTPVVLVTFDLLASNLPLQAAWPVLVANAVSVLAGPPQTEAVTAGTTSTLSVPTDAEELLIRPPSGDPVRIDASRPRLTVDQIGLWSIDAILADGSTQVAVQILAVNPDQAEGDLAREQPDPVEARNAAEAGEATGASEGRRIFGSELLAIVLALVLLEWLYAYGWRPRRAARARAKRAAEPAPGGHLPAGRRRRTLRERVPVLAGRGGGRDRAPGGDGEVG